MAYESEGSRRFLKDTYDRLQSKHEFQPGTFVRWKRGLKNRRRPRDGEVAIVCEVLSEVVFAEESKRDAGSPYFREPLSLVIGIRDDEDVLLTFFVDGRRLEPAE